MVTKDTTLNELFDAACLSADTIVQSGESFRVKDLFRGVEWSRIPKGFRTKLGSMFSHMSMVRQKIIFSLLERLHKISKSIASDNPFLQKGKAILLWAWKEIRHGESASREITNSGICELSGMRADVISFYGGSFECKTDAIKTYRFKGYKCSLQEKNGYPNPACMDECPLIQKKF